MNINPISLYKEILKITEAESKAIDNNDFKKLLDYIEERDKKIKESHSISLSSLDSKTQQEIKKIIEKIGRLDLQNITRIEMQKDKIMKEMAKLRKNNNINKYLKSGKTGYNNWIKG